MKEDDVIYIEGVLRPLIRSVKRKMRLVMSEDDLVQESLLRLLTSSQGKLGQMPEDSYIKRIGRNICIDQQRKEKAEKKALFGLEAPQEDGIGDVDTELWLNHLLQGVSWPVQKAVRMKMNGFTNDEIAKAIGRSEKTVRTVMKRVAKFVEENRA